MYSIYHAGVWCDFRCVIDLHLKRYYRFYVGDYYLGDVYHNSRHWVAAPMRKTIVGAVVKGFKTRLDACEFLIQYCEMGKGA